MRWGPADCWARIGPRAGGLARRSELGPARDRIVCTQIGGWTWHTDARWGPADQMGGADQSLKLGVRGPDDTECQGPT